MLSTCKPSKPFAPHVSQSCACALVFSCALCCAVRRAALDVSGWVGGGGVWGGLKEREEGRRGRRGGRWGGVCGCVVVVVSRRDVNEMCSSIPHHSAPNCGGHVPVDMTPTAVCLCTRH